MFIPRLVLSSASNKEISVCSKWRLRQSGKAGLSVENKELLNAQHETGPHPHHSLPRLKEDCGKREQEELSDRKGGL